MTSTNQPVKLPPRPGHDIGPVYADYARCSCTAEWQASDQPGATSLDEWRLTHPHALQAQADAAATGLRQLADLLEQHPDLVLMFKYSHTNMPALEVDEFDRWCGWLDANVTPDRSPGAAHTQAVRQFGPVAVNVSIDKQRLREAGR